MTTKKAAPKLTEEDSPKTRSRVAIWDVAEHAGVSIATVSRVFNGRAYVAQATRDKVLNSARELGYENIRHPQPSPAETVTLISLTAFAMDDPRCAEIISGITEALHARNARPVVCPITRRHNCGMSFLERVMQGTAEGALLVALTDTEEELLKAVEDGFPFVLIDPSHPVSEKIPVVGIANWAGARQATEHLLTLGHTRVGIVTFQGEPTHSHFFAGSDRLAGFQAAHMASGLTIAPELIYAGDGSFESGYQAALQLLSLPEPPTAIIGLNDQMALGVMHGARERGLSLPKDLSVVGFEDSASALLVRPELTTVRLPLSELGRVAVDVLYRIINGQALDVTRVELSTRLIIRQSTAAPQTVRQRKRSIAN